jgi:hypothetical protein
VSDDIGRPYEVMPTKRSWDVLDYGIDWARWLARLWEPDQAYALGARIRPTEPNGFEYECAVAGQSSAREPRVWPRTIGNSVADGSVVWTCRAVSNASLKTTVQDSVWEADEGLTLTNPSLNSQLAVVTVAGGAPGTRYSLRNRVTLANGLKKEGELVIPVID